MSHFSPYTLFASDLVLDEIDGEKRHPKNIRSYYTSSMRGLAAAAEAGKPFCLLVNVSDPHKPFCAMGKGQDVIDELNVPSRVFTPDEVPIPGGLFVDPQVRRNWLTITRPYAEPMTVWEPCCRRWKIPGKLTEQWSSFCLTTECFCPSPKPHYFITIALGYPGRWRALEAASSVL
ncbi:MAG: hypothetical protein P8K08_03535 [Fuerstiella sp.]|nr:hypothetical protein [Fuerstiella sp.]